MNISTNLKAIDMIKGEILSEIAHLYRTLADYDEIGDYESVTNEIATVIAMDYILARQVICPCYLTLTSLATARVMHSFKSSRPAAR